MTESAPKPLIALGVTGGIAAYKAAELCSTLVKAGFGVQVVMTENACRFSSSPRNVCDSCFIECA